MTRSRPRRHSATDPDIQVVLLGVGPEGLDSLSDSIKDSIETARELWGPEDLLHAFPLAKEKHPLIMKGLRYRLSQISSQEGPKNIHVLCHGDPGLNGLLELVGTFCTPEQMEVHPHIDPVQTVLARLRLSFRETRVLHTAIESLSRIMEQMESFPKVAVYTSEEIPASDFLKWVRRKGINKHSRIVICWPENGIWDHILPWDPTIEIPSGALPATSLFLFLREQESSPLCPSLPLSLKEIQDETFEYFQSLSRDDSLRNLIFSKISLQADEILWDVGAAEGAFSIACAQAMDRQAGTGFVFSLEWEAPYFSCFLKNLTKQATERIRLFQSTLPEILPHLDPPDVVVLQERIRNLSHLLPRIAERMNEGGRIMIETASFSRAHRVTQMLEDIGLEVDVSMVPRAPEQTEETTEEAPYLCLVLGKTRRG